MWVSTPAVEGKKETNGACYHGLKRRELGMREFITVSSNYRRIRTPVPEGKLLRSFSGGGGIRTTPSGGMVSNRVALKS